MRIMKTKHIYRDAVLSFMKLKKRGVMMFDDYRKLLLVNREKN